MQFKENVAGESILIGGLHDKFDILETLNMIREECLDVRTITLGISLYDCQSDDPRRLADNIYDKVMSRAHNLVKVGCDIEKMYGIPSFALYFLTRRSYSTSDRVGYVTDGWFWKNGDHTLKYITSFVRQ